MWEGAIVWATVPKMDSASTNMLQVLMLTKQAFAERLHEQIVRLAEAG